MRQPRLTSFVLAVAVLLLPAVLASGGDTEPNDACAQASAVTPAWDVTANGPGWHDSSDGGTSDTDWTDWSRVDVFGGEHFHLVLSSSYSHRGALYSSCSSTGAWSIIFPDAWNSFTRLESGPVHTKVYLTCCTTHGPYVLWQEVHPQDGGIHGHEAGDAAATASPLPASGGPWVGTIDARGGLDEDWWVLPVVHGRVTFWVTPQECATAQNLDVDLFQAGGVRPIAVSANAGCARDEVSCYALAPATLVARIHSGGGVGRHWFNLNVDATALPRVGEQVCA